uniref:UDP-N-acetylglucosamine--dolichyl-phosphate N-acetylglucosaminephosphotransferase n=1 Tax=Ditylum brightwellii TaxID=49249 RepID=A0A7S2EE03_9STRA|mmetsp:Transcript_25377/g.37791  ORF Transcript_25377/g.37791 Transcript_25377/m.37791 type:complete len:463 (+) Transcript_25377:160-1548(+)
MNKIGAILPLIPPACLLINLIDGPIQIAVINGWKNMFGGDTDDGNSTVGDAGESENSRRDVPTVEAQLFAYVCVAILGYVATNNLIPKIKTYTLKKGISGKDIGKRGTSIEDKDIPEALGIVPGAIFLICLIFCLVGYATSHPKKLLDVNSALLSICFMLFLGFTDDVLDWPWRYKLFLPSVASLPLLCCYEGSTSILVPIQLRFLLMQEGELTMLGRILCYIVTVDENANGAIVNLGLLYLVYMGMLAVFCTNAINIYAGINGLEAGQSYVIGCAILVHNLIEIGNNSANTENHLFSVMIMLSFVGVTLALLGHNWYPASVFVGDTFCYFAGMTFAVVGILGHFSKTVLLFFIPQIINFIYSTPQLFKFVPCPRHRLPKFNPETGLMGPSTFSCSKDEFRWLKKRPDDTEVANMTVINLCLQILGPMSERTLCIVLLTLQVICCVIGLLIRYKLANLFFDG